MTNEVTSFLTADEEVENASQDLWDSLFENNENDATLLRVELTKTQNYIK